MNIDIITLFPEMFTALNYGIPGRAQKSGLLRLNFWNPRDFTQDVHRTIDDRPYGGGPGMVMKYEPLAAAIAKAKTSIGNNVKTTLLSPQGQLFTQKKAEELIKRPNLLLISGRYEGIDERVRLSLVDEELSMGDFVLSGGELPAMSLIDAVTRLLPGALGDAESAQQDSFSTGLLDYPHYTRPEKIGEMTVPEVLLSGDHQAIRRWRLKQSLGQTWLKRKDLLEKYRLNAEEDVLLAEFIEEFESEHVSHE